MKKLRIVGKVILHLPTDIDYFSVWMVEDIYDFTNIFPTAVQTGHLRFVVSLDSSQRQPRAGAYIYVRWIIG